MAQACYLGWGWAETEGLQIRGQPQQGPKQLWETVSTFFFFNLKGLRMQGVTRPWLQSRAPNQTKTTNLTLACPFQGLWLQRLPQFHPDTCSSRSFSSLCSRWRRESEAFRVWLLATGQREEGWQNIAGDSEATISRRLFEKALQAWDPQGTNPNSVPCPGRSLPTFHLASASKPPRPLLNWPSLTSTCPELRSGPHSGQRPQGKGHPRAERSPASERLQGGASGRGLEFRPGKAGLKKKKMRRRW